MKKKVFILCLAICVLFTLSSVCAGDVNDTAMASDNTDQVIEEVDDDAVSEIDDEIVSSSQEDAIGEPDDGTFTALQKKISDAEENSTIILKNDYAHNEGYSNEGITISKSLTIDGDGHTIDGNYQSRFFFIQTSGDRPVILKNINFKKGNGDGVGIFGAIDVDMFSDGDKYYCTIDNCTFENCIGTTVNFYNGEQKGSVHNSIFVNCTTGLHGGSVSRSIFINSSAASKIDNTCIKLGKMVELSPYESSLDYIQDLIDNAEEGGIINISGHYGIHRSCIEITKNITLVGNNAILDGMGLTRVFYISDGKLILKNITIMNGNSSTNYLWRLIDDESCSGGGILNGANTKFDAYNCSFVNCYATCGGAISGYGTATRCLFLNCTSEAVYGVRTIDCIITDTPLQEFDSTHTFDYIQELIDNASENDIITLSGHYGASYKDIKINKTLTIIGDGAILDGQNVKRIFNIEANNVVIKNITFKNGFVDITDNGYGNENTENGGAIISSYDFIVENCNFNNCKSNRGAGGAIYTNCNFAQIINSNFTDCSAYSSGAVYFYYSSSSKKNCVNCIFTNCSAESYAGAMRSGNSFNCTFINCSSEYGGARCFGYATQCKFLNCFASNLAGAAYSMKCKDCIIINCTSTNGGAMYKTEFENCTLINCTGGMDSNIRIGSYDNEIRINVDDKITGEIELFIDGTKYPLKYNNDNGYYYIYLDEITSNDYIFNISFLGDNYFKPCNIIKKYPELNINVHNSYGEDNTIEISINENINDNIYCYYDNWVSCDLTLSHGKGNITLSELSEGSHKFYFHFYGDDDFMEAERTVNFIVSSDRNYLELFNQIENTPQGGTVYLNKDYSLNIASDIVINSAITIDGKGHSINMNKLSKIFTVTNNRAVLKNIIFLNGYDKECGGIDGNCTIINCTFINCSATDFWSHGGAVYNGNVYNSRFINCSAPYGGAINSGYVKNSIFLNCSARSGGAMVDSYAINCLFKNCTAVAGGAITGGTAINCTFLDYLNKDDATYDVELINCIFRNSTKEDDINIPGNDPNNGGTSENGSNNPNSNNGGTSGSSTATNPTTTTTKKTDNVKLTLLTVTVKKSAKKLVLKATLKVNGKAAKNKIIKFKFNGKTYKAKTNKNGVAKITIKKAVLKKLKAGKKVTYQASYGKITKKVTVKVKK